MRFHFHLNPRDTAHSKSLSSMQSALVSLLRTGRIEYSHYHWAPQTHRQTK